MKIVAIVSGKGGVGKSTVATLLAIRASQTRKVLLLDFDLTGPARIVTGEGKVIRKGAGLTPLLINQNKKDANQSQKGALYHLSMSQLIKQEDAVIWRAPKKIQLLEMMFNSINNDGTQEYDLVLIDTPPGISIVHKFVKTKDVSLLFVTTSQNVALSDSVNTLRYFLPENEEKSDKEKLADDFLSTSQEKKITESEINEKCDEKENAQNDKTPFIGVLENMSTLSCPECLRTHRIFSSTGGKSLAEKFKVPYLGAINMSKGLSGNFEEYDGEIDEILDLVLDKLIS